MTHSLTLLSTRSLHQGPSYDVVYMGEDALRREYSAQGSISLSTHQLLVRKLLRNRYVRHLPGTADLYARAQAVVRHHVSGDVMVSVLNSWDLDICGYVRATGKKLLYAIDVWEADVPRVERMVSQVDVVLLAYADSVKLLKARLGPQMSQRVRLFPIYIDPRYYEFTGIVKHHDLIQVGRRDPVLHQWALAYAEQRNRSYLYQKRSSRGIFYFDEGNWDLPGAQLSYRNLMTVLAGSSIALVSPPDRTDSGRTGRVSPLTPRYLEAAMCQAIPVGFPPRGGEYANAFPPTFTGVPRDYESFARLCDELLGNRDMRLRWAAANRAYVVSAHSAIARAAELREILEE